MKNITIQTIIVDQTTNRKHKVTRVIAAELLRDPLGAVAEVMNEMNGELIYAMAKERKNAKSTD